KLAEMIGVSMAEAKRILNQYERQLPFLRQLSDICKRQACNPGYIVLYDGARRHFDKFAPLTSGRRVRDLARSKKHARGYATPIILGTSAVRSIAPTSTPP